MNVVSEVRNLMRQDDRLRRIRKVLEESNFSQVRDRGSTAIAARALKVLNEILDIVDEEP